MGWTQDEPTRTLTEVAQAAGLTLPTAYRMIKALQRESFLTHDSATGRYSLGPAVMDLARVVLQRADEDELVSVALPHLERIRAVTSETVGLHVRVADSRVCVAELVSRQPMRAATGVGRTHPLDAGAASHVLMAWTPERGAGRSGADASGRRLDRIAADVRRDRYATSVGETIAGAAALAIPLFDSRDDVRAAVNITGPSTRWTPTLMRRHLPAVRSEIAEIEAQLGHRMAAEPDTAT